MKEERDKNNNFIYALLNPEKAGNFVFYDIMFEMEPIYIGMSKNKNRPVRHINDSLKHKDKNKIK